MNISEGLWEKGGASVYDVEINLTHAFIRYSNMYIYVCMQVQYNMQSSVNRNNSIHKSIKVVFC